MNECRALHRRGSGQRIERPVRALATSFVGPAIALAVALAGAAAGELGADGLLVFLAFVLSAPAAVVQSWAAARRAAESAADRFAARALVAQARPERGRRQRAAPAAAAAELAPEVVGHPPR